MKKNAWIIMLVVLLAGASLVYAEGMKGDMMGKGMKGGMMGKGMMDGKMMGMCPMMKSMMERSVVATSDGGVIVVMGNKLTKYDKDLNVVKEVELKMDMDGMQKMMENMKGMCPMMKSMMGKGMMDDDDDDDAVKADSKAPAKEIDHASHH
jgi:hypothetical protein